MQPARQAIFKPPLHVQRHQFVIDYIMRKKPRKVADLGCGTCKLLKRMTFHPELSLLVGVDISADLLNRMNPSVGRNLGICLAQGHFECQRRRYMLSPLPSNYLQPRVNQLRIELYQGSVTQKDPRLKGFDLVTSIELIEHLTLEDVESFSACLFGYMRPVAVILTTPNSDYNPLLPGLVGFRHKDHKFEWTRAEFRSWALNVCCEYGYEVQLTGVGEAPPGQQKQVGFCSQIAVFHRLGGEDSSNMLPRQEAGELLSYTMLATVIYPSLNDFLLGEVLSCARRLQNARTAMSGVSYASSCDEGDVQTACGETVRYPSEQRGRVVPGDRDKASNVLTTQKHCEQHRCVSLPVELLWSSCPNIRGVCGSPSNLKSLLMNHPKVTLNHDVSALTVRF